MVFSLILGNFAPFFCKCIPMIFALILGDLAPFSRKWFIPMVFAKNFRRFCPFFLQMYPLQYYLIQLFHSSWPGSLPQIQGGPFVIVLFERSPVTKLFDILTCKYDFYIIAIIAKSWTFWYLCFLFPWTYGKLWKILKNSKKKEEKKMKIYDFLKTFCTIFSPIFP